MEKKVVLKKVKIVVGISFLTFFLGLIAFQVWLNYSLSSFSVLSFIYWFLFFGWIGSILNFKLSSAASLVPAFTLFIVGAILETFGSGDLAEGVLRLSFIGWLIGIAQALIEFRRQNDKS